MSWLTKLFSKAKQPVIPVPEYKVIQPRCPECKERYTIRFHTSEESLIYLRLIKTCSQHTRNGNNVLQTMFN